MLLQPPSRFSKNVARDLVYGCWCKGRRIAAASFPPTTQLSIATVLRLAGQEVMLLDAQADRLSMEQTRDAVRNEAPDVLIIPTTTTTFNEDCQTLSEFKTNLPKLVTMAYGSHVTFRPKDALAKEGLDFCVMREPEWIIKDFCKALDNGEDGKRVNGLAFRSGTGIHVNPPYPWIENLDDIPIPDRTPVLNYAYFNPLVRKMPWTTATTSRGCPGRCIFCTSPFFYGNRLRFNSAERVVDEMEYLKKLGYNEIFFRDETFTANRQRVMEICKLIEERGLNMSWISNTRVDTISKEMMTAMKRAGCHLIKIGVESGSQEVLDKINKGIKLEQTRAVFQWAHEIGMEMHAHTMLGCIGENKQTVDATIKLLKEIEPTTVTSGAFTAYPGTPVFSMVEAKHPDVGDGSQRDLAKIHTEGFFNKTFCDLSDEEVGAAVKKLYKSFYLRPSYIARRLAGIRSFADVRRLMIAGTQVFSFAMDDGE